LRVEAGGIYYANGDYLSAANLFRQAANLKPDYANAHYNLAKALLMLQNYTLALQETRRNSISG
jgi:tetratricopeptide (TPR) repeat protein